MAPNVTSTATIVATEETARYKWDYHISVHGTMSPIKDSHNNCACQMQGSLKPNDYQVLVSYNPLEASL